MSVSGDFHKHDLDFMFSPIGHVDGHAVPSTTIGEKIKSRSYLWEPPETLVYAVYIAEICLIYAILVIPAQGMDGENLGAGTLRENII